MHARTASSHRSRVTRGLLWTALALLLMAAPEIAASASAPTSASAGPGLPLRRLPPGQVVRFQVDSGETLEARFYMVRGDSAFLMDVDRRPRGVPFDRLTRIWKRGRATVAGTLVGAVPCAVGAAAFGAGALMVPGGAVLGGAVGSFFPRWREIYRAPAAAPTSPGHPFQEPFSAASAFRAPTPPPGLCGWVHGATEVGFRPHSFVHQRGWGGSIGILWAATPELAFGAEFGRTEISTDDEQPPPELWYEGGNKDGSVMRTALVARVRPWQGMIRPYLIGGLEFCREEEHRDEPSQWDEYGNPIAWDAVGSTGTFYGVQGGPGVQIGPRGLSLGVQARGHLLIGEAEGEGFFTLSAGLEWR